MTLTFEVFGLPASQGSKRPIRNRHTGKIAMVDSSKRLKPWRQDVSAAALDALDRSKGGWPAWARQGPLHLDATFYFVRPRNHYGTGKHAAVLKASAPVYPAGRPDLSKLARALEDALSSVLYRDDALIVWESLAKRYRDRPGVAVTVETME